MCVRERAGEGEREEEIERDRQTEGWGLSTTSLGSEF